MLVVEQVDLAAYPTAAPTQQSTVPPDRVHQLPLPAAAAPVLC
jgi:hypothetical protein